MRGLFEFEQDGRYPLRRIPMVMRFKLDACGIKLPLIAWAQLSREQRERLVDLPCTSNEEKHRYRELIAQMLEAHADNPDAAIQLVPVGPFPLWRDTSSVPQQIVDHLKEIGLPAPTIAQWQSLNDLQRFALLKLTRAGHQNANLLPALREFHLV
ncbi:MAG TPA: nitrate reductase associated protein [Oxalicibacterium sp.]|jgi:hypothetical protein|nr:nitrate reductase associated protein [Oxalicibacterium sp.]